MQTKDLGTSKVMSPLEVKSYFRDKVICHFVRIRLDLDNPGNFRDYLETAKNIIITNIYDIWADKYDFVQQEDCFPWSETWQLKHILLMIAIYCKELTLNEWLGIDPEENLDEFFEEIEEFFEFLPYYGENIVELLHDIENAVFETELDFNDCLHQRLWPFNKEILFM